MPVIVTGTWNTIVNKTITPALVGLIFYCKEIGPSLPNCKESNQKSTNMPELIQELWKFSFLYPMWSKYLEMNTAFVPTAENTQIFSDHL